MVEDVLITGGAGFIGTRLAARFAEAGHAVTVLDPLLDQVHGGDPAQLLASADAIEKSARFLRGSVTSPHDLREAVAGRTLVVHLAAETGTGQSMYEIDRYVSTNVGGTAKLLEAVAANRDTVRRIIVASSRAVYGEGAYETPSGRIVYPEARRAADMERGKFEPLLPDGEALRAVPTDEAARLHPTSVYGATKLMQETLLVASTPSLGVESVRLRYQNVYGPGQSLRNPYTGILSIFSTLIRNGRPITVFEDGAESRDFVYIDDVVEATYRAALAPDAAGAVMNIGSGVATTVLDVARELVAAYGIQVPVTVSGAFRAGDIRHNVADTRLATALLGEMPITNFATGVRRLADWVSSQPLEETGFDRSMDELAARGLLK